MPTVITHAIVPISIGLGLGRKAVPIRLMAAGAIFAMLPDADVIAFKFGIAYSDALGHRGASHSLLFAAAAPLLMLPFKRFFGVSAVKLWAFLFVALLSHSLLDACTTGGLGVAWLLPFSDERFFAPFQMIRVAPFGISAYLTDRGVAVILSELLWVWLPMFCIGAILRAARYAKLKT
ncbi:MAG: metal-dependent hydrolase [Helicobacteraceae bacterium]|jgi:inner membrane protein|nr:metal-dependent hydrolase [Helicobacteraceae bacterium]